MVSVKNTFFYGEIEMLLSSVCFYGRMFVFLSYIIENFQKTLEREARGAKWLIIWTDCDREGENIGYQIIEVCQSVNRNIRVFRAQFSEITPQSVNNAIQRLAQVLPNYNTYTAKRRIK